MVKRDWTKQPAIRNLAPGGNVMPPRNSVLGTASVQYCVAASVRTINY